MKTFSYLKFLCFIFFVLFLSDLSFGQAEVYIGGRSGINVASFKWDADTRKNRDLSTKSIIGPHVSFVSAIKFNNWFGVQAEAAYIQRGARAIYDIENLQGQNEQGQAINYRDVYVVDRFKTHYIDVPIFVRFRLGGEGFAATAKFGPTFSMAMTGTHQHTEDAKVVGQNQQGQPTEQIIDYVKTKNMNFDKEYNRFDIAATGALGVEIGAGPGAIIADLRYLLGLNDLNAKSRKIDNRIKNRGFQIGLGYIVKL